METNPRPRRLAEAVGDELAALLSPVSPQTFVREYWAKKPLFVKGFADKYKGFFDGAGFQRALGVPGRAPGQLRASFDKKPGATPPGAARGPTDLTHSFPIPPELAAPMLDAGATLCVTEIESRVPHLAQFVSAIKRQLGYPGTVCFNGYLSSAGAGLNWHFDGRIASTLQIEGTKRWRYSNRVAIAWPRGNGLVMSDGGVRYDTNPAGRAPWERLEPFDANAAGAITEVVLEPGDLLILPAGTWHDASGGSTGSLALNLAFTPIPYTAVVGELLDLLLASDPAWRGVRPLLAQEGGAPGVVDPRELENVAQQLEKAAGAIRAMSADSAPVVAVWSSLVQKGSVEPPARPGPPAPPAPIAPTDQFRVRPDTNVYVRAAEKGARLSVAFGARQRTEATGLAKHFLEKAIATRAFGASDCLTWGEGGAPLPWNEVEEFLTRLVKEGLLERVAK